MTKLKSHMTAALMVFALSFGVQAKAQDVLLVAADYDAWVPEVQAKLLGTGLFTTVDIFDAKLGTPTLVQLQAYDAVLVWSDFAFADPTALGDVLADYVDGGGGVVQAMFSFYNTIPVGGRWQAQGYNVWQYGSSSPGTSLTLGTIHQPGHPILAGVAGFNGGTSSYHATVGALNPGAAAIADWSNGRPLIADNITSFSGCVAGLNFFPPSSDVSSDFWDASTDGDLLMANALLYCSGAVTCDCADPAAILGGPGDDVLTGTRNADIICGGGGNDVIYGLKGDDCLAGEDGNDTIYAGRGDDTALGGNDNDLIFGSGGNDELDGGDGTDELRGGRGIDTCTDGEVVLACETAPPAPSDRRLKRDIRLLGSQHDGLKVYAFRYLWSDTEMVGVMAQDLLADERRKDAVTLMPGGFYAVDYAKLGLKMTTLHAWRANGPDALRQ